MGIPDGWVNGAVGGAVLGTTTTVMLAATGKLAGLSGIFDGAFSRASGRGWKVLFLSGFTVGGIVAGIVYPDGFDQGGAPAVSTLTYIVSGFLVGLGTRLGNGCTSGHGLGGLPRLSRRSIVATLTFLTSGIATASVLAGWSEGASGGSEGTPSQDTPLLAVRYASLAVAAVGTAMTLRKREERSQWRAHLASFLCGGSFAGGLVLSGMVKRARVVNFLALRRDSWDASLMFVLGCGVMIGLAGFPLVTRKLGAPLCRLPAKAKEQEVATEELVAEKFEIPTNTELDMPLVLGGWLFGIGWGASGMCPGPAVVAATFGLPGPALAFMPSLLVGMKAARPLKGCMALPPPSWVTGGATKKTA